MVQDMVTKTISKKKKCNKAKWLSEETFQIAKKRRVARGKSKRKGISAFRYTQLNAEFQGIARRDKKKKPSSAINAKKLREKIEGERLETSSRKLEIPEHFMQRWPQ